MTQRIHSICMLLSYLTLAAGQAAAITCPSDAVPVGPLCVDKYEASVWSVPNPTTGNAALVSELKNGTATLGDLVAGGATQLGCDDFAPFDHEPFPENFPYGGNWTPIAGTTPPTPGVYAASVPGVLPTACLDWFQAQQACTLSDKRLPTNAEWQAAAAGTPDAGAVDDNTTDCETGTDGGVPDPTQTGSRSKCKSNWGAFDMVGNVWEWVAEWVPSVKPGGGCVGWDGFSDDKMCLYGVNPNPKAPGALFRGGSSYNGSETGVFAVIAHNQPYDSFPNVGLRCVR
jgi:formylglycine-generating enzyme required for sulfatase activity